MSPKRASLSGIHAIKDTAVSVLEMRLDDSATDRACLQRLRPSFKYIVGSHDQSFAILAIQIYIDSGDRRAGYLFGGET